MIEKRFFSLVIVMSMLVSCTIIISNTESETTGYAIVNGFVIDSITEAPIANASISIYGNYYYSYWNMTDAEGYYAVSVQCGSYKLEVYKSNYYSLETGFYVTENEVRWLNVSLQPLPPENEIVKGYITDSNANTPIANASISISSAWSYETYYSNQTLSDENGLYQMNLRAGSYYLNAYKQDYYSNYSSFQVAENEIKWLNISLRPYPPKNSTIKGYILDAKTGSPVQNASIYISSYYWYESDYNLTYSDETGFYRMNVYPRTYTISVYKYGYPSYSSSFYVSDHKTKWLNITLSPYPPKNSYIKGYIKNSKTDLPVANASVYVSKSYYVILNDRKQYVDYWYYDDYYNFTYSNETGYYEINLRADNYSISVSKTNYYSYSKYFSIEENATMWLNVSLTPYPPKNSFIKGHANNSKTGAPLAGATITISSYYSIIYPLEAANVPKTKTEFSSSDGVSVYPYYEWNSTYTNSSGYYEFNLRAGNYSISAYKSEYCTYQGYLSVEENATVWLNISLRPYPPKNSFVKGYVNNSKTGAPLVGATITISSSYSDYPYYEWTTTYTKSNGYYQFNLRAGNYSISAYKSEYCTYQGYISVEENATVWLNISLRPYPPKNSIIKGCVVDSITGKPIAGARVEVSSISSTSSGISPLYYYNSTTTNATGHYQMNLYAGNYSVSVYVYSYYWLYDYYTPSFDYYELASKIEVINISLLPISTKSYFQYQNRFNIEENETIVLDVALDLVPNKTAKIKGYLYDNATKQPIQYGSISISLSDTSGHTTTDYTSTNSSGYYELNVFEGNYQLTASYYGGIYIEYLYDSDGVGQKRYKSFTTSINVHENETTTLDIYLEPLAEESCKIYGYVLDNLTGLPISDALVSIINTEELDLFMGNGTTTKTNGYYELNVRPGKYRIMFTQLSSVIYSSGYSSRYPQYFYYFTDVDISSGSINITAPLESIPAQNSMLCGKVNLSAYSEDGSFVSMPQVTVIDKNHLYANYTSVSQDGSFKLNLHPSDYIVFIQYSDLQNITEISIEDNETVNITLNLNLPLGTEQELPVAVVFSDWDNFTLETTSNCSAAQSEQLRLICDYSLGNGDGYLNDTEASKLANIWKFLYTTLSDTAGICLVVDDTVYYSQTQAVTFENLEGFVNSTVPVIMHISANYTSCNRLRNVSLHQIKIRVSHHGFHEQVPIYTIRLPNGFVMTSWDCAGNVTISGTTNIIIEPGINKIEYEFITLNIDQLKKIEKTETVTGHDISVIATGVGTINITPISITAQSLPKDRKIIGSSVNINVTGVISGAYITISYNDSALPPDIDESSLKMYYWDDDLSSWIEIENSGVYTNNNTVWAVVSHFTTFALMGKTITSTPPQVITWPLYVASFIALLAITVALISRARIRNKKEIKKYYKIPPEDYYVVR